MAELPRLSETRPRRPQTRRVSTAELRRRPLHRAERARPAAPTPQTEPVPERTRLAWPVIILCWSLILPWIVPLGSLSMQPYRMVLVVIFLPAMIRVVSGKAGRIGLGEAGIFLFSCWICVALFVAHGSSGFEQAGSQVLETLGTFTVARAYIRSSDDFEALARLLFTIVAAVLFPLAILEVAAGRNIVLELASKIMPTHIINDQPPRLGLRRVQSVFEHPILFGVFCSGALMMTWLVSGHGRSTAARLGSTGVVAATTLLSLSSGPISTAAFQIVLLIYNGVLRKLAIRWWLLIGAIALFVLAVSLFAKRPLPAILFSYLALDEASAYFRLLIWEFGSQSVMNHPIFGVGLGQWDRPSWMPFSVDMFWLVNAIVGGLPAASFMALAFLGSVLPAALRDDLDEPAQRAQLAYVLTMVGFFLVGWMVHFWGATYVLFILLMGSGRWIAYRPSADPPQIAEQPRRLARTGDSARSRPMVPVANKRGE